MLLLVSQTLATSRIIPQVRASPKSRAYPKQSPKKRRPKLSAPKLHDSAPTKKRCRSADNGNAKQTCFQTILAASKRKNTGLNPRVAGASALASPNCPKRKKPAGLGEQGSAGSKPSSRRQAQRIPQQLDATKNLVICQTGYPTRTLLVTKGIASRSKCLTTRNKKLVETIYK